MSWMAAAACRGCTDLFFAERGDMAAVVNARRICDTCPVRPECLDWAMSDDAPVYGVLAGLTPRERAQLRRGRMSPPAETLPSQHATTGPMPWLNPNEPPSHTWTRRQIVAVRAADG